MERPFRESSRVTAFSSQEIGTFLDGVRRTERREQLFPPNPPALNTDRLYQSITAQGYHAELPKNSNYAYIREVISRQENKEACRELGRSYYIDWQAEIEKRPYWGLRRSKEPDVSFKWEMSPLISFLGEMPYKYEKRFRAHYARERKRKEFFFQRMRATEGDMQVFFKRRYDEICSQLEAKHKFWLDGLKRFLTQEIMGIPQPSIAIPRRMPPVERELLLGAIPADDPMRGFLDGAFDDCVYRFEATNISLSCEGRGPSFLPQATDTTVRKVFASTSPEDIFWAALGADGDLAQSDPYASVDFMMKVIRPRRLASVNLAHKSGHHPDLDRYEVAVEEGDTLASFLIRDGTAFDARAPWHPLLLLCVRGVRQLHAYDHKDPHWNLSYEDWSVYAHQRDRDRAKRKSA